MHPVVPPALPFGSPAARAARLECPRLPMPDPRPAFTLPREVVEAAFAVSVGMKDLARLGRPHCQIPGRGRGEPTQTAALRPPAPRPRGPGMKDLAR